jgi:hypothetical protein
MTTVMDLTEINEAILVVGEKEALVLTALGAHREAIADAARIFGEFLRARLDTVRTNKDTVIISGAPATSIATIWAAQYRWLSPPVCGWIKFSEFMNELLQGSGWWVPGPGTSDPNPHEKSDEEIYIIIRRLEP